MPVAFVFADTTEAKVASAIAVLEEADRRYWMPRRYDTCHRRSTARDHGQAVPVVVTTRSRKWAWTCRGGRRGTNRGRAGRGRSCGGGGVEVSRNGLRSSAFSPVSHRESDVLRLYPGETTNQADSRLATW
ncbi:hypothetical protein [Streptomyces sp. DSM 118878]